MKHGTLIKHDETMVHAQESLLFFFFFSFFFFLSFFFFFFFESLLLLSYLWSYFPLIIFHTVSCQLYNLKTVRDISMKLGTHIKENM